MYVCNALALLTYTLACIYVGRIDGVVGNASARASIVGISAMTKATNATHNSIIECY